MDGTIDQFCGTESGSSSHESTLGRVTALWFVVR